MIDDAKICLLDMIWYILKDLIKKFIDDKWFPWFDFDETCDKMIKDMRFELVFDHEEMMFAHW